MNSKVPPLCTEREAWQIVSRINAEMADLNRELAQYNQQVEAQNKKLTAQYAKMQAMNNLIESLYRKVADQNALLEERVSERTENLQATIKRLQDREAENRHDAQSAVRVQQALLQGLDLSEHIAVRTIYRPYYYIGGDLYYFGPRSDRLLRGFLIDISGHGLSTALHTVLLHVLLREVNEKNLPLPDTMRWLNQRAGEFFDELTFAGAIAFEIDLELRMFRWVCAGIPKVWVATTERQGVIDCPGMFLGIHREETFELHTIAIDAGDSIYLMTDGISDLLERKADVEAGCLGLADYEAMLAQLGELADSAERRDDATAVCFHVQSLPESLIFRSSWPRFIQLNGYGDYQRLRGVLSRIIAEATGQDHSLAEVAIQEALANAMECRDGVSRQHQARVKLNRFGNRFVVRVQTSRIGFAGNAVLRRLRSEREAMFIYGEDASMGRGIPIMLSVTDKMTYNSEGTELLLAWRLNRR